MMPVMLKDILPPVSLQGYVIKYQVFRFIFDQEIEPPIKFHAPRPEHSITFYPRDKQRFSNIDHENIRTYPRCVINGLYDIPILRYGGTDFWAIKVVLQPSALYNILSTPIQEFTNDFIDAEQVWGNKIHLICEELHHLNDIERMIGVIEKFLHGIVYQSRGNDLPIDRATRYLLNADAPISLDWLASQSCLCKRQFIRKFEERVGLSAKTYARIIRFDRAFRMKNNRPELDWLYIAIACGYYDYQHLARDYKEFTGCTPPAFYEIDKQSPERTFGLHEK
jgi:AraC-like DNA-binding protein